MEGTILIANVLGWALVPFVLSLVYGCTSAGSIKISPMLDILAVIVGISCFCVLTVWLRGFFGEMMPNARHWAALFASIIGQLGLLVGVCASYKVLYAGKPKPAASH